MLMHPTKQNQTELERSASPPSAFVLLQGARALLLPSRPSAVTQAISRSSSEIRYRSSGIYLTGCPSGGA